MRPVTYGLTSMPSPWRKPLTPASVPARLRSHRKESSVGDDQRSVTRPSRGTKRSRLRPQRSRPGVKLIEQDADVSNEWRGLAGLGRLLDEMNRGGVTPCGLVEPAIESDGRRRGRSADAWVGSGDGLGANEQHRDSQRYRPRTSHPARYAR